MKFVTSMKPPKSTLACDCDARVLELQNGRGLPKVGIADPARDRVFSQDVPSTGSARSRVIIAMRQR